jgi:NhaP-type Na+/H+ or K+/H+ antiporter
MLITVLGGAGLGFVWGWLMGRLVVQVHRSPNMILALSTATLLLAVEVLFLASSLVLVLTLVMAVLSLILHLAWQHRLRKRFGPLM